MYQRLNNFRRHVFFFLSPRCDNLENYALENTVLENASLEQDNRTQIFLLLPFAFKITETTTNKKLLWQVCLVKKKRIIRQNKSIGLPCYRSHAIYVFDVKMYLNKWQQIFSCISLRMLFLKDLRLLYLVGVCHRRFHQSYNSIIRIILVIMH